MVQYIPAALNDTFAALADPTRRAILTQLTASSRAVSDIAAPFKMSLTGVTKHLRVLECAGLIRRHKIGRVVHCHLEPAKLQAAADWLAEYRRFWTTRLDALGRFLQKSSDEETPPWPPSNPKSPSRSSSNSATRSRPRRSSRRGPTRSR